MTRGLQTVVAGFGLSALLFLSAVESAFAVTNPTYDGSSISRGVSSSFILVVKVGSVALASCSKLANETDMTRGRIAIFMTDVSANVAVPYDKASSDTTMTFMATPTSDAVVTNDTATSTCSITFNIKVTETVSGALAKQLKNHSNTINFFAKYSENGTVLSTNTTADGHIKATVSVVQSAPVGFSATKGDSKVVFKWSGSSTGTVVTDAAGTTSTGTVTGVMLVAIANTSGDVDFPTMEFNADTNATSDNTAETGTCHYSAGFNDGESCVSCGANNIKYYITNDPEKLAAAAPGFVSAVAINDTTKSRGEISGLTVGKTYSVFMFNMQGGLTHTACYRVTPYEGESYAQANGETKTTDNPRCFVATAAFGSPLHKNIKLFTWFRSHVLLKHSWGRSFVHWYNIYGPQAAQVIATHPTLALGARTILWAPALLISLWLALAAHEPMAIAGVIAVAMFAAGYMIRVRNRRMA